MVCLRCSKCGSDSGFIIETQAGQRLDVRERLPVERIKRSVLVTCMYCNTRWDQVPVSVVDPSIADRVQDPSHLTH